MAEDASNLLMIMSDQHAPGMLGAAGNEHVRTPNLDALAADGTSFSAAACPSPICVPSRASLATGRHVHELGTWSNAFPYTGQEADSWGHRLTEAGRRVTTIGKLHYRSAEDPTGVPDQRLPIHVVGGTGDVYPELRGEMPPYPGTLDWVRNARTGEGEFTRFDAAVSEEAARWLHREAPGEDTPWCLFVSFVQPHFPLVVPEPYAELYPPESVPLPPCVWPDSWPDHPAINEMRRLASSERPLDEPTIRQAIRIYMGMVTFLDEQVGRVLEALRSAGLASRTRVLYTSDHGEMLGEKGLWGKYSMYEPSVGVPMLCAGPDIPRGSVVPTPVSLVDVFPSVLEATGVPAAPEDGSLPGRSLWGLVDGSVPERWVLSEYHAKLSADAAFMIRSRRFKYVHHVGAPPQLFDMLADPDEIDDLAADPAHEQTRAEHEALLRSVCDPDDVDRRAKADQAALIERFGGKEQVARGGAKVAYTPAPEDTGSAGG